MSIAAADRSWRRRAVPTRELRGLRQAVPQAFCREVGRHPRSRTRPSGLGFAPLTRTSLGGQRGGASRKRGEAFVSGLALGLLFRRRHAVVMFSGMPIAFALGFVAMLFMAIFMPASSLSAGRRQNVYEEMASIRCCRSRSSF